MSNGSAALSLVEPAVAPSNGVSVESRRKPAAVTELETKVGQTVASGVMALALAAHDYADLGALTPASRTWCGAMLGQVAQLRLNTLGEMPDFAEVAFTEGRRAIQRRPDGVLLAWFGKGRVDEVIDELIGHVIRISSKVVNDELALRTN